MAGAGKEMAPELRREREASKLDLPELTTFIDGGEMITEVRKRMGKLERRRWVWHLEFCLQQSCCLKSQCLI